MQVLIEGQAIKHELYGMGVVMESNSERTTIDFEDYGSKKFVTSIWVAELIGEAPEHPVKPRRGGRRKKAVAKAAKAKPQTRDRLSGRYLSFNLSLTSSAFPSAPALP